MQAEHILTRQGRYVITAEGHEALKDTTRCACRIVLQGFWAICPDCGTCYANLREEGWSIAGQSATNGKRS